MVNILHQDIQEKDTVCKETWGHTGGLNTDNAAVENYAVLVRQLNQQKKLPGIVFR